MGYDIDVPIRHRLTYTDISGAKLKVDQTTEITHLSCGLVAYVGVVGVLVIGCYDFGSCVHK